MNYLKYIYHWFKNNFEAIVHLCYSIPDIRRAKNNLVLSENISEDDKGLLNNVSLRIHHKDGMYKKGKGSHYLLVGLSAIHCIKEAIENVGNEFKVTSILDFPCGYGRVLRFLRATFPNSEIAASELNSNALKFCSKHFKINGVLSKRNFSDINLPKQFDLIWCGSLFTHVDELTSENLLKFFYEHLSDHGICVFTTHGNYSSILINSKKQTYGMTEEAQQKILRDFQTKGYGFANYRNSKGYGISLVNKIKIMELAHKVGNWNLVMFKERGWDTHQDVYVFKKT